MSLHHHHYKPPGPLLVVHEHEPCACGVRHDEPCTDTDCPNSESDDSLYLADHLS